MNNKQAFKMTLQQFKQALIDMGYKVIQEENYGTLLRKRYKTITIQECEDYDNVYYENYNSRNFSYEYNQHRVSDFAKALKNILKFERKLGK